jgi:hypothetical protein
MLVNEARKIMRLARELSRIVDLKIAKLDLNYKI